MICPFKTISWSLDLSTIDRRTCQLLAADQNIELESRVFFSQSKKCLAGLENADICMHSEFKALHAMTALALSEALQSHAAEEDNPIKLWVWTAASQKAL